MSFKTIIMKKTGIASSLLQYVCAQWSAYQVPVFGAILFPATNISTRRIGSRFPSDSDCPQSMNKKKLGEEIEYRSAVYRYIQPICLPLGHHASDLFTHREAGSLCQLSMVNLRQLSMVNLRQLIFGYVS
jgi:hypothetical protein